MELALLALINALIMVSGFVILARVLRKYQTDPKAVASEIISQLNAEELGEQLAVPYGNLPLEISHKANESRMNLRFFGEVHLDLEVSREDNDVVIVRMVDHQRRNEVSMVLGIPQLIQRDQGIEA